MKLLTERARSAVIGCALAVVAIALAACGGKESVASRSAAALRDAQEKGVPLGGGHGHGGHAARAGDGQAETKGSSAGEHATMTGMDHATMPGMDQRMPGMDHSTMQPAGMAGMDHSNMPRMQHGTARQGQQQPMAGMDHGNMPGMQHGTARHGQQQPMAGMDHSNMPGMQQGTAQQGMEGMDHGNMPGMQRATSGDRVLVEPPTENREIAQTRPAATLQPDAFDMPAPIAVSEAAKAMKNAGEGDLRHIVPGTDHENPPSPQPATRTAPPPPMDHSQHGGDSPAPARPAPAMDHSRHGTASAPANRPAAETTYTCPMHPEVTSTTPGTCPKCGMALVRKNG